MRKNALSQSNYKRSLTAAGSRLRRRLPLTICLLLVIGAGIYLFSFWQQWSRPGKRHYLRGLDAAAAQNYKGAEQEWLWGTREDPRYAGNFQRLGDLYGELRRYSESASSYAAAVKLDAANGEVWLRLSKMQQLLNNKQDALQSAQRAAELLPQDARALGQYGIMAAKQYKRPEALAALQRAHRMVPSNTDFLFALINVEMDQMDLAAAERDLIPFLQAHPTNGEACYLMAVFNHQKPRTPENIAAALTYARRAMPGMLQDTRGYLLLGSLYLEAQNPQRALRVYGAGYRVHPHAEGIIRGLVDCYQQMGDTRNAARYADMLQRANARHDRIRHLEQVMGFDHFDTRSGLELARLEEEEGDSTKALVYYQQLLRQSPQNGITRRALVDCLNRMGQTEMAAQAARPDFIP